MWIVNLALKRPYTFIVMAILIVLVALSVPVLLVLWRLHRAYG